MAYTSFFGGKLPQANMKPKGKSDNWKKFLGDCTCEPLTNCTIKINTGFTNTDSTASSCSGKIWSKYVYYLHVTILYVLMLVLYIELRDTKRNIHDFHMGMLNLSVKHMQLEASCFQEITNLKESVLNLPSSRFKREAESVREIEAVTEEFEMEKELFADNGNSTVQNQRVIRHSEAKFKGNIRGKKRNPRRSKHFKVPQFVHFKGAQPDVTIKGEVFPGLIAPWYADKEGIGGFDLSNGISVKSGKSIIEINRNGLYLIYAQAYYMTSNQLNSFTINWSGPKSNQEKVISTCSTSNVGSGEVSCFTAVVRYLAQGDHIFLKQRERNRRLLFRDGETFLGLLLLGKSPSRR